MRPSSHARVAVTLCAALAVLSGCSRARAQSRSAPAHAPLASPAAPASPPATPQAPAATAPWYDASPLLAALREPERAQAAGSAGVARLEDLPLYDLGLSLDPEHAAFTLREEVFFTNTTGAPLDEVVLRIYANASPPGARAHRMPQVHLLGGSCPAPFACSVTAQDPSVLAVRPAQPLAPGAHLRVALELNGALQQIDGSRTNLLAQGLEGLSQLGAGEGDGDYGVLGIGDGIASLANFYAVVAPRRAGEWERGETTTLGDLGSDELSNVRARVEVPAGFRLATTGVALREAAAAGGRRATEVGAALVRDFAVLASAQLVEATRNVGGVTVRSVFLPAERAAGERVLDVAAHALEQFERRFGAYPYADLDVVEAPLVGGAGGVEFAGLVTVASMFYRPITASSEAGGMGALLSGLLGGASGGAALTHMTDSMLEFVTAHEVAHQFWHGLVGSDSRVHPFVDEGLAQWSAMLYLEDRYGAARAQADGEQQVAMNYKLMRMLGQPDAPVDRPVGAFGGSLAYAGLVYGKGPYVYRELRRAVGDAAFFAGLRAYVQRYRFRTAGPASFVDLLATGRSAARVRAIARRWLEETHGDEDLGRADLRGMLGGLLGGGAGGVSSGELEQALQLVQGMLGGGNGGAGVPRGAQGHGGRGAGANGAGAGNGAGGDDAVSPEQLEQMLQQFQQTLEGTQ